jgi:RHS repeat-associated protein
MSSTTDNWTYQYDGLGNRVATAHNGTVTQYLNDPSGFGNVEAEFNGSGQLVSHYTYGLDLTSSIPASGSAAYYHFDGAGNTAQMTSTAGTVVNSYTYLPFGEKLSSTAGVNNPFTYVGEYGVMDEGSGLYFMRNRWYSPVIGRFVQQDPIGLAGGTNLYGYTGNNPTNWADPLGTEPDPAAARGNAESYRDILDGNSVNTREEIQAHKEHIKNEAKDAAVETTTQIVVLTLAPELEIVHNPVANFAANECIHKAGESIIVKGVKTIAGKNEEEPEKPEPKPPSTATPWFVFKDMINFFSGNHLFPKQPVQQTTVPTGSSRDPNGKITSGFGDQGYIQAGVPISYTIFFENESTATAPAEIVTVTDPLDTNLDWSTVQLDQIQFNNVTINVPDGAQSYTGKVNVSTDTNPVKVTASLNPGTGVLSWKMQSIDPVTGGLPANPMAGFLPPNNSSNQGTGYVTFNVLPKTGLADGATISNTASIVFDVNAAITTNTVTNTIDTTAPISTVDPLPATTTSTSIPVSWSGSDPSGSGIASYNIFVSMNGSAYSVWLPATTLTSSTYTGAVGNTYSFYSIATSNVGTVQKAPGAAQSITVAAPVTTYTVTPSAGTGGTISPSTAQIVNSGSTASFTVAPNSGFQIVSVTGCGGTLSGTTYTTGAITADCSVTATFIALAPIASLTPSTLSFTAISGVTSAPQTATLSNTGNAPLTISGITLGGTNPGDFAQSNTCGTSLAAGSSCTISVTFTPGSASSFTATLSVADDASGSPQTTTLSGTGTVAPSYTVTATPASQTVKAASAATYTVNVAAQNGTFASAVTLTASGLPTGATASFSPASVTPGNTSAASTLTIQTSTTKAAAGKESPVWPLAAPALAAIGLFFVPSRRRRRWLAMALLICASLSTLAFVSGCGGSSSSSNPQSYTITITGTSGSVHQSTSVQLTVE